MKRELTRICHEHPNELVTTLVDYSPVLEVPFEYDVSGSIYDSVCSKEQAIEADMGLGNLLMNFELHEFEAYLYCNAEAFRPYGKNALQMVGKIVHQAGSPESRIQHKRFHNDNRVFLDSPSCGPWPPNLAKPIMQPLRSGMYRDRWRTWPDVLRTAPPYQEGPRIPSRPLRTTVWSSATLSVDEGTCDRF